MAQPVVNLVDSRMTGNFINSWEDLRVSDVGQYVIFTVQGAPRTHDVKKSDGTIAMSYRNDGSTFRKLIFSVKHKSMLALSTPFVIAHKVRGMAAEKAGDKIGATEHFQKFLRSVQVSFSLPIEDKRCPMLTVDAVRQNITFIAKVELRTGTNGQILTIDPSTIAPYVPVPVITGKTAYRMDDNAPAGVVPPTTPNIFGAKPKPSPMETIDEDGVILETADMNFEQLIVRAKGLMIGVKGKDTELLRKLITEKELELLLDNEEDAPLAATGTDDNVAEVLEP